MIFLSHSEKDTKKLASVLAYVLKKHCAANKQSIHVLLKGDLGSGKTFFTSHLAKELRITGRIQSPTFVIWRSYPVKDLRAFTLHHLDCYRINRNDLKKLGFFVLPKTEQLCMIEWPEKAKIFKGDITFKMSALGKKQRKIEITAQTRAGKSIVDRLIKSIRIWART